MRLKHGCFHLKLFLIIQDLSQLSIETGFWPIWDVAQISKIQTLWTELFIIILFLMTKGQLIFQIPTLVLNVYIGLYFRQYRVYSFIVNIGVYFRQYRVYSFIVNIGVYFRQYWVYSFKILSNSFMTSCAI